MNTSPIRLLKWLLWSAFLVTTPLTLAAQDEAGDPRAAEVKAPIVDETPIVDKTPIADETTTPNSAPETELPAEAERAAEVQSAVEPKSASDESAPREAPALSDSVAGETPRVIYPEDRPEWVEAAPAREGEIDRIAVASGPHYSLGEARRQLDEAIRRTADEYVNRHLGVENAGRYIRYEAAPVKTFEERPEFSFGPMYQAHAQLQFDEAFRRRIEHDWQEAVALSRLVKIGLGGAAVLVLLAVLLGYLKADNATRGFYTRRLRLGAATVILALAAVIYFAVRSIPWI